MKYPKILHLWYSDKNQTIYSSESSFSIKDNESLDVVTDFINFLSSVEFTVPNIESIFAILEDINTTLCVDLGGGEFLRFYTDDTEKEDDFTLSKGIVDNWS